MSAFGIASALAVTNARSQNTVSVDELGNGFYNGAVVGAGFQPDHFNGGIPGFAYTLPFIYTFPQPVADILLNEPGNPLPSDLLRFTRDPNGPNTLLFFYSDASAGDPPDAPADVLGLPNVVNLVLVATETGLFGNPYTEAGPNGLVYTANPGMAGDDGSGIATQYTFINDTAVPEPGTLALSAGGLGMFGGFKLLRRKVRS
ncbi:MAG: PEP-CTERM sorting domain-containing protein [Pedosphaera sp.]|nr:PEP-CTERM sorting domain-containing protein [Pedosphaera sp.]